MTFYYIIMNTKINVAIAAMLIVAADEMASQAGCSHCNSQMGGRQLGLVHCHAQEGASHKIVPSPQIEGGG